MADDRVDFRTSEILSGQRLGPILEEDIAFSSMAQDKIGHSYALYQILNKLRRS
jgi:1,2-phenylacetyl-CoA epoxidase catalytic subunit